MRQRLFVTTAWCCCTVAGCATLSSHSTHTYSSNAAASAPLAAASATLEAQAEPHPQRGDRQRQQAVQPVAYQSADETSIVRFQNEPPSLALPTSPQSPDAPPNPRVLSLRAVIDMALLQNPDAVIARAGAPVSDATRIVSATYPWNPSVQVEVDPYARDVDGNFLDTRNVVSLTQTLELAHQGRYRRVAAAATWNRERATIAQAEWTAVAAVMRSYFEALYRQGLLEIAHSGLEMQTQTLGVTERRFNAGLASPTERLTATIAARQAQHAVELADIDYQSAVNSLQALLNLVQDDRPALHSKLVDFHWLSPQTAIDRAVTCSPFDGLADLVAASAWVSNRPDVIAAGFAVSSARANLELAKANVIPNVTTGPTYERDESGTLFFGVAAQMELPTWNTGCPLVRQRAAELQQQMIICSQTRLRAAAQAQAAAERYSRAQERWAQRSTASTAGDNELIRATDAFEQGQATILEVLSIQDSLLQERKSYLDLLNEVAQAATDLIAALAIDPEWLIESPGERGASPSPELAR